MVRPVAADRAGRAGVQTARAAAATRPDRRVGFEVEGGEQFGQEEPGAEFRVEEHRALAVPARAGFGGEIALQHRAGIDVVPLPAAVRLQKGVQRAQLAFDQVVVIVAPGVAGDASGGGRSGAAVRGPCQ